MLKKHKRFFKRYVLGRLNQKLKKKNREAYK